MEKSSVEEAARIMEETKIKQVFVDGGVVMVEPGYEAAVEGGVVVISKEEGAVEIAKERMREVWPPDDNYVSITEHPRRNNVRPNNPRYHISYFLPYPPGDFPRTEIFDDIDAAKDRIGTLISGPALHIRDEYIANYQRNMMIWLVREHGYSLLQYKSRFDHPHPRGYNYN